VVAVVARLRSQAARALVRIDPSPAFLDEVLQSLQVNLLVRQGEQLPHIATYRGEGSLSAWLTASAVRLALKLRPRREEEATLLDQTAVAAPELELIKERYRRDFERCFADELAALPKRSRSLLRLHYVDGLGIDQLAAIYHVSRATTARWLAREREGLVAGVRRRLTAELGIAPAELQSLMQLVVSQLHVSLARALA
jgi:RNA polymerase sigma-70 factor (ECF subfamily)